MVNFNENGFVLSEKGRDIFIPISREKGPHFQSTEKVLQSIPSLRKQIEEIQTSDLQINDIITINSKVDIKFHLVVTRYRSDAPANLQYVIGALNKMSAYMRTSNAKFAVAPLIQSSQVSNDVMRNIIQGIYGSGESDVVFYLGDL